MEQTTLHNDAISLTQALVRMNTINPPGHEDQCAHLLARLLGEAGFDCRFTEFSTRRTTLIAKLGGRPDKLPLCFTGHVDVVPLGAALHRRRQRRYARPHLRGKRGQTADLAGRLLRA